MRNVVRRRKTGEIKENKKSTRFILIINVIIVRIKNVFKVFDIDVK